MATETADSHQITTSDEQTVKLSSEAVKAAEKINISSPEESVEDDRKEGKPDKLHAPDFILSTSEEKAKDIQIEPPVIEVKKTDETPVVDIPIHNDVKLEKESIPDNSPPERQPSTSTEPVGEKTTEFELPVITSLEENLKIGDSTEHIKSPPEEQPIPEFVAREALEVPAAAPTEKVQEPTPEAVDVLKLEVKSSDYTVDSQSKEQPAVAVQPVTGVPEEQEILPVPAEKVEEKQPQIVDNPELSVVPTADSGKDPEKEQPVVSVEKEQKEKDSVPVLSVEPPKKEEVLPENEPLELIEKEISELVEPPKKEEEKFEVLPVNESVEMIPKEISELVEFPKKEEEKCEVIPANEPVVVIAKEITELVEPPKKEEEKIEVLPANEPVEAIAKENYEWVEPVIKEEQPIEIHPVKESGEVIAKEISEPIEVPKEKEQASEVPPVLEVIAKNISEEDHPAKELIVKEIGESIEPPKNNEQPDAVLPKKESEEVIAKEMSASEPPKDKVIESGEVKGKETSGSALVSVELEKQEPEVSPPLDGEQIHGKEAQYTVESAKQDSVGQVSQPGSTTDSGKGQANEQPDTEFVRLDLEKEPKEESEKTPVPEILVEPPKIEVLPVKEPEEVIAKEISETTEPPIIKKEQPIDEVHPVKGTEPNKADDEKIEESNLPDSSTAAEVAEKSVEGKKTDKEDALIAEASVETGNAEHVEEKHNVIETPKELQEPEVEIKDKETVITGVDNPDSSIQKKEPSGEEIKLSQNMQKEVPSKPTHKHSNNILSKVKQSLVKAKKAIIGKSPSSKTMSSEARDDIKVK